MDLMTPLIKENHRNMEFQSRLAAPMTSSPNLPIPGQSPETLKSQIKERSQWACFRISKSQSKHHSIIGHITIQSN